MSGSVLVIGLFGVALRVDECLIQYIYACQKIRSCRMYTLILLHMDINPSSLFPRKVSFAF